jgi:hypothetical protein
MKKQTIGRLKRLRSRLKRDALVFGHYKVPLYTFVVHHDAAFDRRDKSKAFRCVGYVDAIGFIQALDDVLDELMGVERWRTLCPQEKARKGDMLGSGTAPWHNWQPVSCTDYGTEARHFFGPIRRKVL